MAPLAVAVGASLVAPFSKPDADRLSDERSARLVHWILVAATTSHLVLSLVVPMQTPAAREARIEMAAAVGFAGVVWGLYLWRREWVGRHGFAVLVSVFLALGVVAIRSNPEPHIDVWVFQQQGAAALSHGINPYEVMFPNIYTPEQSLRFYGPTWLERGYINTYPYPPAILLAEVASFLLTGDYRYALLGSIVLAALGMVYLAPHDRRRIAELAALCFLYSPTTLFVMTLGWTEPIVVVAWVGAVIAARRLLTCVEPSPLGTERWLAGASLGVLATTKQYSVLLLLPPLLRAVGRLRRGCELGWATLATAIIVVPFLVWNPREFVHDVVVGLFRQPLRVDALSMLAIWGRMVGPEQVPHVAVLGAFVAAAIVVVWAPMPAGNLGRAACSSGAAVIVFLFLNKLAFCNYYWLAFYLLCASVAIGEGTREKGSIGGSLRR
jgi:hypothetical protein